MRFTRLILLMALPVRTFYHILIGLTYLWLSLYVAGSAHAIEVSIGHFHIQEQSSNQEETRDGLSGGFNVEILGAISDHWALLVSGASKFGTNSPTFPYEVYAGVRHLGQPLSESITPYLKGTLGYIQTDGPCKKSQVCIRNVWKAEMDAGLLIAFSPSIFLFLEAQILFSPLYYTIKYPDKKETTGYGINLSSWSDDFLKNLAFGLGFRF